MSFFKSAEKKFDSFFSAFGHYFEELFGSASVEAKVNGTLTLLTPAVVELVNLAGGPGASAIVTAGLAQFKADYATLCAVTQGSFPAPGGNAASLVSGLITSLHQNLTAIVQDAGVKNSANSAKITGYANFFLNEAEAILEELETAAPAKTASAPVAQMPTPTAAAPAPAPTTQADPTLTAANDAQQQAAVEDPTAAPAPAAGHVNVAAVKPLI